MNIGRYRILKEIAEGGSGTIYLAQEDRENGSKVVIKKLKEEYKYDRDFIHLLRSEAETLSHLLHPNVIRVYEFVSEEENHYAVLEYVDGVNLRGLLEQLDHEKKKLPANISVGIIYQLVSALDYIHSATDEKGHPLQIIHSDLNPNNILIGKSGLVKLIDFSIAQTAENKLGSTAGVGRGVITYMSPEQADSEPIDIRSDVFSVGILLHEMLMGETPFAGRTRFEVYKNLMTTVITADGLPSFIHENLRRILGKALAKKPEERYQTVAEFRKELESYSGKNGPSSFESEIANFLLSLNLKGP